MPGVTISAGFGAGGSIVAPAVAEQLGFPLLDRAIGVEVAAALDVSVAEAEDGELKRSFTNRFLSLLAPLSAGVLGAGTQASPENFELADGGAVVFRDQAEQIMRDALVGGAVILGRAGAAATASEPSVLRVRLCGPKQARTAQAVRLNPMDPALASRQLSQVDSARDHYVWRLYKVHAEDPALYQLQIDSTVVPLSACAEIIVAAYRAVIG